MNPKEYILHYKYESIFLRVLLIYMANITLRNNVVYLLGSFDRSAVSLRNLKIILNYTVLRFFILNMNQFKLKNNTVCFKIYPRNLFYCNGTCMIPLGYKKI